MASVLAMAVSNGKEISFHLPPVRSEVERRVRECRSADRLEDKCAHCSDDTGRPRIASIDDSFLSSAEPTAGSKGRVKYGSASQ